MKKLKILKNPLAHIGHTKDANFSYAHTLCLLTFEDVERIYAKYFLLINVSIILPFPMKLDHYDLPIGYITLYEKAFKVWLKFPLTHLIELFIHFTAWSLTN